jgi:hypothetical protein
MGRTENGIRLREITYEPLPSQKLFHQSDAAFKGFSGPVGSGKSQALCQEALRLAYINAARWGLIGAPTYPMLKDVTQPAFFEILDFNSIPYEFNKGENLLTLLDTRSRIMFRAVDEYERLRGTNLAWFGVDELTYAPEESWLRLEARLRDPKAKRRCGFAVWTPRGFDWVYRKFISEPVKGYHVTLAKPYENRFLLDKVPEYYNRLQSSYDEALFKQEVMGEYLHLHAGLVYRSFDRSEHVTDLQYDRHVPLLWSLDFNYNPMSSVVAQKVRGKVHVLDEIVIRGATTEEACEAFCRRYPNPGSGVVVYGDASGYARNTTGASDYDVIRETLQRAGIRAEYRAPHANPPVRTRINLVNSTLQSASGDLGLLIDRKCKELIKDLEQVAYKGDTLEIDKDRDRGRTHTSDALGYLVWQECGSRGTVGEQNRPLLW